MTGTTASEVLGVQPLSVSPDVTPANSSQNPVSNDISREIGYACSEAPEGLTEDKVSCVPAPRLPALSLSPRLLLGPGPTNFSPEVVSAFSLPPLGYMDPGFLQVLSEIQGLLRYAFQTTNEVTIAISGTGSAAMEAALSNLIEPGDVVLVACCGYFGRRMADMAMRYGADVRLAEQQWGSVFTLDTLRDLLQKHRPAMLCVVMTETSTGALQPLAGLGQLCRAHGALLVVDAVTGLCTSPLYVDQWQVDVCYSCSQKGLGCCPGASPITFSPRAMEKINSRSAVVSNWYLDLRLLMKYWSGASRVYHHTPPMTLLYGLREALRLVAAEGLEKVWKRHTDAADYLYEQLSTLGLQLLVTEPAHRSPALTTVVVPPETDAGAVSRRLLAEGVEIGAGIGELAGKVWRIGLMATNAKRQTVDTLMNLLAKLLSHKTNWQV